MSPLWPVKHTTSSPMASHIDMRRAGRLRGIDDHERTGCMGHGGHACNVDRVAGHIGGVRHHHGRVPGVTSRSSSS